MGLERRFCEHDSTFNIHFCIHDFSFVINVVVTQRMSNYGYLEKQGALLKIKPPRDPLDKDEDDYDHLDDVDSVSTYSVKLFVVYSASFRVPSLLFSLHSASGAPVPLSQIQKSTTFFRQGAPLGDDDNSENATFPAITQEQHPSLEYSCYSLHPCHTPSALAEILSNNLPLHKILFNNTPTHITSSTEHALKILVTWFMITSTAVNLCPL